MTTPARPRDSIQPAAGEAREPTQSLSLDPGEACDPAAEPDEPSHPSLALGTQGAHREPTSPASPGAARGPARRADTSDPDRGGEVLGSYRLVELLGRGGMGYVYRAEHVKLGREVALKLLRSDYARRRDAVARFFQEARTVNRVRHRNIVDVTDFVELDDGTTFIIMELLRGQSLGRWALGGFDLARAAAVLVQICDGLGAAHDVGVIHRDLKPDNIIIAPTPDGAELVKLLDFGVAKLVNRDDEDVGFQTAAGSVIGTPAYMSPEQAGGMAIDARSDIYSLGAIMYELFCGQPMFRGRSFGEYVRRHLTEAPVPPRATAGGAQLDARLEAVILRCLAKDPDGRFASIYELRDALLALLGGGELAAPPLLSLAGSGVRMLSGPSSVHLSPIPQLPGAAASAHAARPTLDSTLDPGAPTRTPWWLWLGGAALAAGLGVAAALWYTERGELPAPPPSAEVAPPRQTPPAEPPPLPEPPRLVEVKFDARPAGGVFAEGGTAELCRTPCTYNLDPRELGAAGRRTFVVRAAGHREAPIVVDLTAPARAFVVTLAPEPGGAAAPAAPDDPAALAAPDDPAAPAAPDDPGASSPRRRARPARPANARAPAGAAEPEPAPRDPDAQPARPAREPEPARPAREPEPAHPAREPQPAHPAREPQPARPAREPIDPTDTLDPFRSKP